MNRGDPSFQTPLLFQLGVDAMRNVTKSSVPSLRLGCDAANPVIVTDICCCAM